MDSEPVNESAAPFVSRSAGDRPADRTRSAMREKARRGLWPHGNPPLGYDLVTKEAVMRGRFPYSLLGNVVRNEDEADLVGKIFRLYIRSGSTTTTAAALNDAGFRGRNGGEFQSASVHAILTNSFYIGRGCFGRRTTGPANRVTASGRPARRVKAADPSCWIEIPVEPIIEPALWKAAQALLASRRGPSRSTHPRVLLDGRLLCGDCGAWLRAGRYRPNRRLEREGGDFYACERCDPLHAGGSPRPQWATYPGKTIHRQFSTALGALLPDADRELVLEYIFGSGWPLPAADRRLVLRRSGIVGVVRQNPFTLTLQALQTGEPPEPEHVENLVVAVRESAASHLRSSCRAPSMP